VTLSRTDASSQLDGAGLRAKRALGQNFVVDANTVRRIARLADVENHPHVLEIGAGLGSLTLALAEIATGVTAIEVDEALLPLLNENVGELGEHTDWVLVANLPYNVATPLIADVLDFVPQVSRMLVMVQKEVADRFAASPSTSAYGALSVKVAFHATARVVGQVPASVFLPRPNVESSLVEITRRTTPLDASVDKAKLFALVRMGFAKRRKMLRGSLAGSVEAHHFEAANIAPTARAEELSVHDWLRLAHILEDSHK
jgi:16S rRNA (adenine1518-N6/adenine1519-N6)-dimethyltransferase